jgi:hypothetical protein
MEARSSNHHLPLLQMLTIFLQGFDNIEMVANLLNVNPLH